MAKQLFDRGVPFWKMQGCGNDFVVIDNREMKLPESVMPDWARSICRKAFGVGADGLILLDHAQPGSGVDYRWHFYNADGSRAEMCGNGSRCATSLAHWLDMAAARHALGTDAGPVLAEVFPPQGPGLCEVKVQLTAPRDLQLNQELTFAGEQYMVQFVNTGVPHAVVFPSGEAHLFNVKSMGQALRNHPHFQPAGTNANFAWVVGPDRIKLRTYERGVEDETYACGTGAAATALVANALGLTGKTVAVETGGGETLTIHLDDGQVFLQGAAQVVFTGVLNVAALGLRFS